MKKIFFSIGMIMVLSISKINVSAQELKTNIWLKVGNKEAMVNGNQYIMDTQPKVDKGNTYVPLRFIADNLEGKVNWNKQSQTVTINKDSSSILLKIGSNNVNVNGKNTKIDAKPIMENDRILVPLRFIANTFNLGVEYNSSTKEIKLFETVPPVAEFQFEKSDYIAGEPINVIEKSYSPNGESIVERIWEVNKNSKNQSNELNKIFNNPREGKYNIRLKVRNTSNIWSDWIEKEIIIGPHPKPVIKELLATKTILDQGEEINFLYTEQIQEWEKIVEERWTYRKKDDNRVLNGKPRALFEEGSYIITLEIKDSYGAWSEPQELELEVNSKKKSTELSYKFNKLIIGENVDNFSNYNFQNYQPVDFFNVSHGSVNLLFSNSPETIKQKGILYSDKVSGANRLVYHHKNGMINNSNDLRLVVIAQNHGNKTINLNNIKMSNMGPSKDILHLGQAVTYNYLNATGNQSLSIPPNGKRFLYDTKNRNWPDKESLSGIIEFYSESPVSITIAAVSKNFNINSIEKVPVLERDGIHTRGTFENANKYYNLYVPIDRPSKISFGQNDGEMDSWLVGYDAITKDTVYNKGNYGVLYEMVLHTPKKTGVILNGRGTSFKGAFKWKNDKAYNAPGKGVLIGSNQGTIVGVTNNNSNKQILYSLSNGSSAPVLFNFIPEDFWDNYEIINELSEEIEETEEIPKEN